MHHTERLKACLQRVICDPAFPLAELDAWFTPDYCQEVNGERLDYPAFHQHIATLRRHLAGASIEFVATLAQGERCPSQIGGHLWKSNIKIKTSLILFRCMYQVFCFIETFLCSREPFQLFPYLCIDLCQIADCSPVNIQCLTNRDILFS